MAAEPRVAQGEDPAWNLARIADDNLLAKPCRARADDVLRRVLGPRELLLVPRSFVEAYHFEATRDDGLRAATR